MIGEKKGWLGEEKVAREDKRWVELGRVEWVRKGMVGWRRCGWGREEMG